jgi:hypothetical protein
MKRNLKLPQSEQYIIRKKDAYLVWTCDENDYTITDFRVYDMSTDLQKEKRWQSLQKYIYSDVGMNCAWWGDMTLLDVLIRLFNAPIKEKGLVKQIWKELGKIQEWTEGLGRSNEYFWIENDD